MVKVQWETQKEIHTQSEHAYVIIYIYFFLWTQQARKRNRHNCEFTLLKHSEMVKTDVKW